MFIFGCASYEQFKDELAESDSGSDWIPCDGCEPNYINACSCCSFASPSINDSLNYKDDEDW